MRSALQEKSKNWPLPNRLLFLLWLCLAVAAGAEPHKVVQGSLIDIRFGQASVEVNGVGRILEYSEASRFTLNSQTVSPEVLAGMVKEGAKVGAMARFDPESGEIVRLDAYDTKKMPAVQLWINPGAPVYTGEVDKLTVTVPPSEAKRLNLQKASLLIPGLVHDQPFQKRGQKLTLEIPTQADWEFRGLPVYLISDSSKVYRGRPLQFSTTPPQIAGWGPKVASPLLERIPCWVQLSGPAWLRRPERTRIAISEGAEVSKPVFTGDRIDFWLRVKGPGVYRLKVDTEDRLGRGTSESWDVVVLNPPSK